MATADNKPKLTASGEIPIPATPILIPDSPKPLDIPTEDLEVAAKLIANPFKINERVKNYDIKLLGKKLVKDYLSRCSACY